MLEPPTPQACNSHLTHTKHTRKVRHEKCNLSFFKRKKEDVGALYFGVYNKNSFIRLEYHGSQLVGDRARFIPPTSVPSHMPSSDRRTCSGSHAHQTWLALRSRIPMNPHSLSSATDLFSAPGFNPTTVVSPFSPAQPRTTGLSSACGSNTRLQSNCCQMFI